MVVSIMVSIINQRIVVYSKWKTLHVKVQVEDNVSIHVSNEVSLTLSEIDKSLQMTSSCALNIDITSMVSRRNRTRKVLVLLTSYSLVNLNSLIVMGVLESQSSNVMKGRVQEFLITISLNHCLSN